jgi:hypothetical protein
MDFKRLQSNASISQVDDESSAGVTPFNQFSPASQEESKTLASQDNTRKRVGNLMTIPLESVIEEDPNMQAHSNASPESKQAEPKTKKKKTLKKDMSKASLVSTDSKASKTSKKVKKAPTIVKADLDIDKVLKKAAKASGGKTKKKKKKVKKRKMNPLNKTDEMSYYSESVFMTTFNGSIMEEENEIGSGCDDIKSLSSGGGKKSRPLSNVDLMSDLNEADQVGLGESKQAIAEKNALSENEEFCPPNLEESGIEAKKTEDNDKEPSQPL